MKQLLATLTACALFVGAVAAHAADLRDDVVVTGDELTLGDLFTGLSADRAMMPIAAAPGPGQSVTLGYDWVTRVALAFDVPWEPRRGQDGVTIRRADAEELAAVTDAIRAELSGFIVEAAVATDPVPPQVTEPAPSTLLALVTPEPVQAAMPEEEPMISVPTVSRRMRRDDVVGARDIIWIEVPNDNLAAAYVRDADELIGMSLSQGAIPGRPIQMGSLTSPLVVTRNDAVTMLLQHGSLSVTARGRALEDGAVGDRIRVANVDSSRVVDARVVGPGTVLVEIGLQMAAIQ